METGDKNPTVGVKKEDKLLKIYPEFTVSLPHGNFEATAVDALEIMESDLHNEQKRTNIYTQFLSSKTHVLTVEIPREDSDGTVTHETENRTCKILPYYRMDAFGHSIIHSLLSNKRPIKAMLFPRPVLQTQTAEAAAAAPSASTSSVPTDPSHNEEKNQLKIFLTVDGYSFEAQFKETPDFINAKNLPSSDQDRDTLYKAIAQHLLDGHPLIPVGTSASDNIIEYSIIHADIGEVVTHIKSSTPIKADRLKVAYRQSEPPEVTTDPPKTAPPETSTPEQELNYNVKFLTDKEADFMVTFGYKNGDIDNTPGNICKYLLETKDIIVSGYGTKWILDLDAKYHGENGRETLLKTIKDGQFVNCLAYPAPTINEPSTEQHTIEAPQENEDEEISVNFHINVKGYKTTGTVVVKISADYPPSNGDFREHYEAVRKRLEKTNELSFTDASGQIQKCKLTQTAAFDKYNGYHLFQAADTSVHPKPVLYLSCSPLHTIDVEMAKPTTSHETDIPKVTFDGKRGHTNIKQKHTDSKTSQYKKESGMKKARRVIEDTRVKARPITKQGMTVTDGMIAPLAKVAFFALFGVIWVFTLLQLTFPSLQFSSVGILSAILALNVGLFFFAVVGFTNAIFNIDHSVPKMIEDPKDKSKRKQNTQYYVRLMLASWIFLTSCLFTAIGIYKVLSATGLINAPDYALGASAVTITSLLFFVALTSLCLIVLTATLIGANKAITQSRTSKEPWSGTTYTKLFLAIAASCALTSSLLGILMDVIGRTIKLSPTASVGVIGTGFVLRIIGIIIISGVFMAIGILSVKNYLAKRKAQKAASNSSGKPTIIIIEPTQQSPEQEQSLQDGTQNSPENTLQSQQTVHLVHESVVHESEVVTASSVNPRRPLDPESVRTFLAQESRDFYAMKDFLTKNRTTSGIELKCYYGTLQNYIPVEGTARQMYDTRLSTSEKYTAHYSSRTEVSGALAFETDVKRGTIIAKDHIVIGGTINSDGDNVVPGDVVQVNTNASSVASIMQQVQPLTQDQKRIRFSKASGIINSSIEVLGFVEISYEGNTYYYTMDFEHGTLNTVDVSSAKGVHDNEIAIAAQAGSIALCSAANIIDSKAAESSIVLDEPTPTNFIIAVDVMIFQKEATSRMEDKNVEEASSFKTHDKSTGTTPPL